MTSNSSHPDTAIRPELGRMGKSTVLVLTRKLLDIVVGLGTATILARALGPAGQGVYSLAILLPTMLVMFLNLGVGPATVYYLGKSDVDRHTIAATAIIAGIGLGVVGLALGSVVAVLFTDAILPGVSRELVFLAMPVIPLKLLSTFLAAVFQGLKQFRLYLIATVSQRASFLLLLALLLVQSHPTVAVVAFNASLLVQLVLGLLLLSRAGITLRILRRSSITYVRRALWYGFRSHLSNILAFLNYRLDMLILGALVNPIAVGLYTVAVKVSEQLWILSSSVSAVLFPHAAAIRDDSVRRLITGTVSRAVLWASMFMGILLFALSPLLVRLLFGTDYSVASDLIRILVPGIVVGGMARVLSNYIAAVGRPEINTYIACATVSTNVILNFVLIPRLGAAGAAIATSTTYGLNAILKCVYLVARLGFRLRDAIGLLPQDLRLYRELVRRFVLRWPANPG